MNWRSARLSLDDRREDAINSRYATALALWSGAHGCCLDDYTDEQLERRDALMAAGGDATLARGLVYGLTLYEFGRISEWEVVR